MRSYALSFQLPGACVVSLPEGGRGGPGAELYRRTVREYNEGLRTTFSGMKGIVLIDMERLILDQFPNPDTILSPDGVHLNRTGNDFYFMAIGRRIARSLAG